MSDDLRKKYKIKDTVKGVVILGVDASMRPAAEKRLARRRRHRRDRSRKRSAIADDCRSSSTAQEGRPADGDCLLVASADGDTRFVALSLQ